MAAPYVADREHLRDQQYRDPANLRARMALHARFSTNAVPLRRWLFDRLLATVPPAARVLEVGCGPGDLWVENADRVPPGWTLTLSDLSPGMVEAARAALASAGVEVAAAVVADAEALPFTAASFDAVVANGVLYHVPDIARAIAEARRVLAPGGTLHAWTVGGSHLIELDELVGRLVPGARTGNAVAERFGLENGAALLAARFADVRREDYPDGLAITEPEPVIDYVRSWGPADAAALDRLCAAVADAIQRDGAWHVTKASGVFVAR